MSEQSLSASLLRLKLLDALGGPGDISKIDSIINELSTCKATLQTQDIIQLKETIFHYAVQVSSLSTLQHLVANSEKYSLDINSQDAQGNTPLHLAAMASRLDIVKYLLSLPNINDTIMNLDKKQPVEVCKDLNIAQLMQFERAKFVEKSSIELRQFFSNRDFKNLENLLVLNPRANELLDINGSDPKTGNTVLHEFIGKNDIEMCDWILNHGGDPFKRDKRGKLPIDLVHNNDRLKKLIKTSSKEQNIMDPMATTSATTPASATPPTYKGYLRKWTNFTSGYKLRYFVLDQFGILSYYTNQDDTNNSCRGSLNLGYATLHLDSSEKLKFEIFGKNGLRWHLKANHPIETNRWVWTLQNAITIARDNLKRIKTAAATTGAAAGAGAAATAISTSPSQLTITSGVPQSPLTPTAPDAAFHEEQPDVEKKRHRLRFGKNKDKHKRTASQVSVASFASETHEDLLEPPSRSSTVKKNHKKTPLTGITPYLGDDLSYQESDNEFDYDVYDLEDDDYDSETDSNEDLTSLNDTIANIRRSVEVEMISLLELFNQISTKESINDQIDQISNVGGNSLKSIYDLFNKYNSNIELREFKLKHSLERQLEVNRLWERSIRQLEKEMKDREEKLSAFQDQKKQLKKLISTGTVPIASPPPAGSTGMNEEGTLSPFPSKQQSKDELLPQEQQIQNNQSLDEVDKKLTEGQPVVNQQLIGDIFGDESDNDEFFDADEFEEAEPETLAKILSRKEEPPMVDLKTQTEEIAEEEEEEDEQELIETAVPEESVEPEEPVKEVIDESLNPVQKQVISMLNNQGSFLGYENPPRLKLSMDEDNRPKVGLWGILKSLIGKDMTRMTLPVSFNEPTSLLQRLAEDIEYSSLLNDACKYSDSCLRLIYVSTFATTEYSSTINRIAKPFNPLLGETFEYVRPDESYRLFVEQVSHHPPISACRAESPKWDYYGENAVDSKFTGRSFDFKHLGKMFCVLRPDKGVIDKNGKHVTEELYSWKKVNTAVVGIMLGNPTVDNYGKMLVENHTTGDKIIVDMKQRGWRASSAYQLSGQAHDSQGIPRWAMGGHWNSKIYAKKITKVSSDTVGAATGEAIQRRNSLLDDPTTTKTKSDDPFSGQKFLVWQVAPRPNVPFNLTSFAITLNGIDDKLEPWLAPTDTRLRPDQRDMENGLYDRAADEKHRVEVKQRQARKEREEKNETYVPNWFVKKKHPVTGDIFWEFNGEYWIKRKEKQLADTGDIF
ncbi:Oxysterol-binding protein 2 [Spathaspora sp. JA1]|nr:Oxysterol-binding protein 2 [Spathaspora sp. JA1]